MNVIVWRHAGRDVCASARPAGVCACARGAIR